MDEMDPAFQGPLEPTLERGANLKKNKNKNKNK